MNKSKRIKNPKVTAATPKKKRINTKLIIISSSILVVLLVAALLFDQLYEKSILKINGDKYRMSDLTHYFYSIESQYDYYDQMFGGQYWDMSYDETSGVTMRDVAKQEAIEAALYNEILYREAVSEGYSLTEDEKKSVSDNVDNLLNQQLPEKVIKKNNFTKAYLTDIVEKTTLVARFRQDKIDSLDIDDEGIKAGIKYEDYRQYDIEYLTIPTTKTDDEGNSVEMTAEEKAAAYEKISALLDKAKVTEDWSTLVPEDEEELTYHTDYFVENDTNFSDEFKGMMMEMGNGQISDVYEAEDGYYIVRMVNNLSYESYDNAVSKAISDAESEGMNELYQEIKAKYDVTINNSAVRALSMGNITLVK